MALGQGTTTNSPNMMAEVYQLKLSATSHPMTNVDTRVYYGFDGRDVSLNQYPGERAAAPAVPAIPIWPAPRTSFRRSWFKQNAGL